MNEFMRVRLQHQISKKWTKDRPVLPLKQEDWGLYKTIHNFYWHALNRLPDLVHCRDFNDRVQWLKLFNQDEIQIKCTDKLTAKEFARERVGEQYIIDNLQVCNTFDEIDFSVLPDRFVIKPTHESGGSILIHNKNFVDKKAIRSELNKVMKATFGVAGGEWAYSKIKPQIIIENMIGTAGENPPDYKFYCVNGEVKFCHYLYDRHSTLKEQIIDLNGNDIGINFCGDIPYGRDFVKPENWTKLIDLAAELSRGMKMVRVDLYSISGSIFFGEMTFWPGSGVYQGDGQRVIAERYLDFDRTTYLHSKHWYI